MCVYINVTECCQFSLLEEYRYFPHMDSEKVHLLICQYLHENGYKSALAAFEQESGYEYTANEQHKSGELVSILDEYHEMTRERVVSKENALIKGDVGDGSFANRCLLYMDKLWGGANILALRLTPKGVLIAGSSGGLLAVLTLPVPLPTNGENLLQSESKLHSAAVITVDYHPHEEDLVLTGSMDRKVCLVQLSQAEQHVLQTFDDHKKFVVRVRWSYTGKVFATASYDQSVCTYRRAPGCAKYECCKQFGFKGQVEAIAFRKTSDVLLVAVRNDHRLHIIHFSEDEPLEVRQINMNALGDDYVSFTAMDVNYSPCDKFVLVSTDRNRLIIYNIDTGAQVANFYGSTNDEYSQPRNCWHPSGHYIYSTSQDQCIIAWEVSSQGIVAKLQGHTGLVRDLWYCESLSVLASCGFDGSIRLWHNDGR